MLKPSNPNIQKIMFLRDVVIPFVKEREREGKVDLGRVLHPCGAPSCLLGWAMTFSELELQDMTVTNEPIASGFMPSQVGMALGISYDDTYTIFGSYNNLDDRAKACDQIIERMVTEAIPQ